MNEEISGWLALIGGVALLVGGLMMLVGTIYVNHYKNKLRLIELGYGLNNKWARGVRISFFDANYLFGMIPTAALAMQARVKMGKPIPEFIICPCLRYNENYNKVWQECKSYCVLVSITHGLILISAVCLGIGMANDKGWL